VEYNTWNCDVCGTVYHPPTMRLALERLKGEVGHQATLDEAMEEPC
jgi:hypothetical protein